MASSKTEGKTKVGGAVVVETDAMITLPRAPLQSWVQSVRANWIYLAIYLLIIFVVILILSIVYLHNHKRKNIFILMSFFVLLPAVFLVYWRYRSSSTPIVMQILEIPAPVVVASSGPAAWIQFSAETDAAKISSGIGNRPIEQPVVPARPSVLIQNQPAPAAVTVTPTPGSTAVVSTPGASVAVTPAPAGGAGRTQQWSRGAPAPTRTGGSTQSRRIVDSDECF